MKQPMHNRILSFLLAFLLFLSNVPFSVLSIGSSGDSAQSGSTAAPQLQYDYNTMYIARDGKQIQSLPLLSHEKIELSADGIAENAKYQWQVEHPEKEGVWVNVYDGTEKTISVTLALVENVLRENGTAKLRCRAYTDTYAYLSNTVTVVMAQEQTVSSKLAMAPGSAVVLADDEPVTPEFVTVTIEYILYHNVLQDDGVTFKEEEVGNAFTSYVATLQYDTPLETKVHCPTVVGYAPSLTKVTEGSNEREPKSDEFDSYNYVVINQPNITQNIVYRVEYRPAEVKYEVRYFFQNIYDDLYVENAALVKDTLGKVSYPLIEEGFTGTHPDKTYTEAVFAGFTSLYYEPETIAADGSTVFHVYYERNYYLMDFDCNGGYGTDTVYVRYGTHISVPTPVKAGWLFDGWDLVGATNEKGELLDLKDKNGNLISYGEDSDLDGRLDGDGNKDELPENLPNYNTAYKALWKKAETSYTVAYWILDDNGNKTYLGSRAVSAKSGDIASGKHDLDGTFPICGSEEHIHSDACYVCGFTIEHTHNDSCFTTTLVENDPNDNGRNAIMDLENGGNPESGYIYVIYNPGSGTYWPKLYLDGKYYVVNNTQGGTTEDSYSSIINGGVLAEKTGTYGTETLTTKKYRPATNCGTLQHTHVNSCRTCEEHTHSQGCYHDEKQLIEVHEYTYKDENGNDVTIITDKNVTVLGDGSTVVNVYYQYKKYTLKFYYAATTGGTLDDNDGDASTYDSVKIVGGTTNYFGEDGPNTADDEELLKYEYWNASGHWGEVSALPTLNAEGERRNYDKGEVEYEYNGTAVTYHYISFKARYGDDISDMWPCAVFNSATRTDKDKTNGWSGTEAFVSAWNGEHHVKYSQTFGPNYGNETIKGVYEKLDDMLLFDSKYLLNLTEEDKKDPQKNGTEVSYLCFWENGANINWSVPELYRYNIWLEGNAPNGEQPVIRDGKTFYLADSYDTCDNSSVAEQTQVGLTGYTEYFVKQELGDSYKYSKYEYTTLSQQDGDFDGNLYKEGYVVNFYYTANTHSLKFWNHNGWLGDGNGAGNTAEGEGVRYGTPMRVFGDHVNADGFMDAHYPAGLEPGAYEFAGWYTTAQCLPGTEVDWDTMTMPDADLTVYAKWQPVVRDVYFYYDYKDYQSALKASESDKNNYYWYHKVEGVQHPEKYPIEVEHGSLLGTTYSSIPEAQDGYTFVGWFYIDEQGKKRFAPDTMEVKKDLHLFAEWQSGIDTQYNVQYVLEESDGSNPAGTPIAAPTTGHLTAGKTKTFQAKVTTDLYEAFRNEPLFPLENSHSILMQSEKEHNTHTFRYKKDERVFYIVRYVDKITGVALREPKIQMSTKAIVTEKFLPFTGYIPDDYFIRKVLAYDGTENNSKTPETATEADVNELNEIVFYYTPDEDHALYTIEYYTQNLDGTTWPETPVESIIGSDDLNETVSVTIDPEKFDGFSYSHSEITTYNKDGSVDQDSVRQEGTPVSGTLTEGGLEIRVYYKRNQYPYTIQYVEHGTGEILGYKELDSDALLSSKPDSKDLYGRPIEHTVSETITVGGTRYDFYLKKPDQCPHGGRCDDPDACLEQEWATMRTQSLNIRASNTENVLTFYYQAKQVDIYYVPVCKTVGAIDFGKVSLNKESAATVSNISGSNAMAGQGYKFVGWFTDPMCTNDVNAAWRYMPGSGGAEDVPDPNGTKLKPRSLKQDLDSITYYALFEPITTDLTIKKDVADAEESDNFLFRIQGQGKHAYIDLMVSITGDAFVVINNLPIGEYRITELTDWSWECGDKPTWTFVVGSDTKAATGAAEITVGQDGGAITFTNTFTDSDWLENETSKENIFTGVTAP